MKKVLYFILLIAELFVGSLFMISLWGSSLYIPIAIAVAALVGLSIWQIVRYVKTIDVAVRRKILFNLVLIMLIPSAVFWITYIVIAVALVIAFV